MFNIILSTVISRHFTITVILSEQPHLALFQMHNLARELRKKKHCKNKHNRSVFMEKASYEVCVLHS